MLCSNNIKLQRYLQDCKAFNFLIISTVGVSAQFLLRHFYLFWLFYFILLQLEATIIALSVGLERQLSALKTKISSVHF